jgi:hypothetical protein
VGYSQTFIALLSGAHIQTALQMQVNWRSSIQIEECRRADRRYHFDSVCAKGKLSCYLLSCTAVISLWTYYCGNLWTYITVLHCCWNLSRYVGALTHILPTGLDVPFCPFCPSSCMAGCGGRTNGDVLLLLGKIGKSLPTVACQQNYCLCVK